MASVLTPPSAFRLPPSRRDFVKAGVLGLTGLSLADVLRARAADGPKAKDTSVILVWLGGGSSHIDMWDMKPDAPEEVRGEFTSIESNLPGLRICEHLPMCAKHMDKISLIRSVTHKDSDHASASHYTLTGYEPTTGLPANETPSIGSIVAKERGPRRAGMPAYVAAPEPPRSSLAAYLGVQYNPFSVGGDPGREGYSVRDLILPDGISLARLDDRRKLLGEVDGFRREADRSGLMDGLDSFNQKAFEMVTSTAAQNAFDLTRESDKTRDRYGRTTFGQSMLLARRLIESGVTFVTVKNNGWDTHQKNFSTLKDSKLPEFDRPYSALLEDVHARGLAKNTLVILLTEFGRSWFVSKPTSGREHWPQCNSILFSGGGLKEGQIIGSSDAKAAFPKERPITPEDIISTMYHVLGVDQNIEYLNEAKRPMKILNDGTPIRELVG